jgi:hypothetical protein
MSGTLRTTYLSANIEFLQSRVMPCKKFRKGTVVHKRSKYLSSTAYQCINSPRGQRALLPYQYDKKKNTIRKELINTTITHTWVSCTREVPRSRSRKINLITPKQKHDKLQPPKAREWQTAVLNIFKPKLTNYFEPLSSFAHQEETDMVRDKTQAAAAMRIRMGMLGQGHQRHKQQNHHQ